MKTEMNRSVRLALLTAVAASAVVLTGCVANPAEAEKSDNPEVWGYVASAQRAQLELEQTQMGVDELVVDRALVPDDAWVVVHLDDGGKPGMRVGLAHIDRGESKDVKVKLEGVTTPKVIVAIHADRGTDKEFDFDMMNREMSPDRPFFVDEKELATVVTVREFGVAADAASASLSVSAQPGATDSIRIDSVAAPRDAWIVVHLDDDGAPGARVGLAHIEEGTSSNVEVELDPVPLGAKLLVAVHADRGAAGLYEFDMMDKLNSPDQPFFVVGEELAAPVAIR